MALESGGRDGGLIGAYLADLHRRFASVDDGEVATYIPELAKADPNWFGLAIATIDGAVYTAGDVDTSFTIQSVSKPFLYGLALQTLGRPAVLRKVGVEPTGDAFNSTVLDLEHNRPFNPMVNAGAIAVSALVRGADYADKRRVMLDLFARYAGHAMTIDEATYRSEAETGDRNRMIAGLMAEKNMIEGNIDEILDLYFSQCSVEVTCRDLAMMAAVLANGGVHPLTGERALAQENVHDVLTVMNSCGMYNYAGQWSYEVGIPAKSGVSGGIAAVIPGQIGIAAFSPRLDGYGNSVRAIAACKKIADDFGLHVFRTPPNSGAAIRREMRGDAVRSKRARTAPEREILAQSGAKICILEAQGMLYFGAAERVARRVSELESETSYVVLDLRRVYGVDSAARALIARLVDQMQAGALRLVFAHLGGHDALADLHRELERRDAKIFTDRDSALEWCESQLIAHDASRPPVGGVTIANMELFQGLSRAHLQAVERLVEPIQYEPGEFILREGEEADSFLVVVRGSASVRLGLGDGRSVRIATIDAGAIVGEVALFGGGLRSADVVADDWALCYAFNMEALRKLGDKHPEILLTVYKNLTKALSERLRAANLEIRALEQ